MVDILETGQLNTFTGLSGLKIDHEPHQTRLVSPTAHEQNKTKQQNKLNKLNHTEKVSLYTTQKTKLKKTTHPTKNNYYPTQHANKKFN